MYVDDNDRNQWESSCRIGIVNYNAKYNDKYLCTNRCITCVRNGKAISDGLFIEKITSEKVFINKIKEFLYSSNISEVVFTGIPRGEPLLDHVTICNLLGMLKENNIKIYSRVNSGYNLNSYTFDILNELKLAGLTRVAITVNALGENEYNFFCRPMIKNAYINYLNFIKDSYAVFGNTGMIVSYIDRGNAKVPIQFQKYSFCEQELRRYLCEILNIGNIKFKIVKRGYLGKI